MAAFAQWLIGFVKTAWIWLVNHGIDFCQVSMDALVDFIIEIVSLFPSGAVVPVYSQGSGGLFSTFVQCLNWFFPIQYLVTMVGFLVTGMLAYVLIAPLARWLKMLN